MHQVRFKIENRLTFDLGGESFLRSRMNCLVRSSQLPRMLAAGDDFGTSRLLHPPPPALNPDDAVSLAPPFFDTGNIISGGGLSEDVGGGLSGLAPELQIAVVE